MRKLDRGLANIPLCLANYSHLTHKWDDLTQKKEIWDELDKFQYEFCVYCESIAKKGSGHIEHFFHKSEPSLIHLTFDWNNLFGCCSSNMHCGHFKDQILPGGVKRHYNPNALIRPDVDDPEDFLQFLDSGKVEPKNGISNAMKDRALQTIAALNLDCSELNSSRESQIDIFKKRLLALSDIDDESLILAEYANIYQEAMSTFHRTALKQSLPWW